jgi:PQQ-like domain
MKRQIALPAAVLAALVVPSCGSSPSSSVSSPSTATPSPASTAPVPPAYDPPHRFSDTPVSVGSGPVALADGVAYSYTDTSLVATALVSGSPRWSVPLPGASTLVTGASPDPSITPLMPGIVTDSTSGRLVVAAYSVTVSGSGTEQDKTQTQIVAIDPAGHVRWHQTIATPSPLPLPRVVGGIRDTRGSAVVIDGGNETAVLDASTGTTWWTTPKVKPLGVDGDVVIGVRPTDYGANWNGIGLRGSDGSQTWNVAFGGTGVAGRPPALVIAGPGRAVVTDNGPALIDTTTGKTVTTLARPDTVELGRADFFNDCQFDDRSTVVCWAKGQGNPPTAVGGFDRQDGHQLWGVTDRDPNRTPVDVTCVYNGVIYGTAKHGLDEQLPVEVDARTGHDLVDNPRLAPTQVTAGFGLITDLFRQTRPTTAYPATS